MSYALGNTRSSPNQRSLVREGDTHMHGHVKMKGKQTGQVPQIPRVTILKEKTNLSVDRLTS